MQTDKQRTSSRQRSRNSASRAPSAVCFYQRLRKTAEGAEDAEQKRGAAIQYDPVAISIRRLTAFDISLIMPANFEGYVVAMTDRAIQPNRNARNAERCSFAFSFFSFSTASATEDAGV
jgi:hypothetical protein